jgi:DNA-binding response OmpR family regulator
MAKITKKPEEPKTTPPRILVVEDEPQSMHILERILTSNGFDVLTASGGNEAKELLTSSQPIDVVLSDWIMPVIDGVELCKWVKSSDRLRKTFFILVTIREETRDKVTGLDSGADDYVTKPYHEDELVARIRAGLRLQELQREVIELERKMAVVQVAATAAHEINNPLTGIFGYLDLLRASVESGATKEALLTYIDKISGQAVRVRDTVARLSTLKEVQTKEYLGKQRILDLNTAKGEHRE